MTTPMHPEDRHPKSAPDASIGRIVSVTGAKAIVLLDSSKSGSARLMDDRPEMGTLLAIDTNKTVVLAIVSALSAPVPAQREGESELWIAELGLVGELWRQDDGNLSFNRGVTIYPALGDRVRLSSKTELSLAFFCQDQRTVRVGTLRQDVSIPANVRVDDLLGKHFAVLGTTGTGKSCSTALILRAILKQNPAAHIVLLDPHNEYATAFKEWGEIISPRNMQLPFWLLTFDELQEVLLAGNERKAEIEILQELIPIAKAKYAVSRNGEPGGNGRLRRNPNDPGRFTVDTPVPYRISDLTAMIDERMGKLENKRDLSPYRNVKARIEQVSQDARYAFMFGSLTVYDGMAQILGRIFRVPVNGKPITIFELTGLPPDIVKVVVSVLCRMTFDFAVWADGKVPVTLVCEEAHRYVPAAADAGFEPCKRAIAKIAKEGRKYGASLCVVTQRPAEIDPTILSQCNTVFALRMSNDKDQAIVHSAVSDTGSGLLEFLPALGQREAIAFGDGVSLPVRIKFDDLPEESLPRSSTAHFSDCWQDCNIDENFLDHLVDRWRSSGGEFDETTTLSMLAENIHMPPERAAHSDHNAAAHNGETRGYPQQAPEDAHAHAQPPPAQQQRPAPSLRRETAQAPEGERRGLSPLRRQPAAPAQQPELASAEPAGSGSSNVALKSLRERLSQRSNR